MPREATTFLAVGGAGYVVDVLAFNWLRGQPVLAGVDPAVSKVLAVCVAMVVTYLGNRLLTWRDRSSDTFREVTTFVVLNLIGLGIAVATLVLSHDVLGLTSPLADNIAANVVGLGLGTAFRYWSYRRFVFTAPPDPRLDRTRGTAAAARPGHAGRSSAPPTDQHGARPRRGAPPLSPRRGQLSTAVDDLVAGIGPLRRRVRPALSDIGPTSHLALTYDDGPGLTGAAVRWYRPPYGLLSPAALTAAREADLRTVLDSRGFQTSPRIGTPGHYVFERAFVEK